MLAGCAGAPVQEMSNARQAVKAAERAGAATVAPRSWAKPASGSRAPNRTCAAGEYRDARDEAELARAKAVEARRLAEDSAPQAAPPPP